MGLGCNVVGCQCPTSVTRPSIVPHTRIRHRHRLHRSQQQQQQARVPPLHAFLEHGGLEDIGERRRHTPETQAAIKAQTVAHSCNSALPEGLANLAQQTRPAQILASTATACMEAQHSTLPGCFLVVPHLSQQCSEQLQLGAHSLAACPHNPLTHTSRPPIHPQFTSCPACLATPRLTVTHRRRRPVGL